MKFFSYDSKFSQWMLKLVYSSWLNILWMVCSIPIVTLGAATSALYYVTLAMARGEEGNVTAMFFRAFRRDFKQATVLWLIMLGLGLFLGADVYVLWHLRQTAQGPMAVMWTLLLAVVFAAAVIYVIVLLYVFPLTASVQNSNRAMLKNALMIGTHYLFCTICMFVIHFAIFFVTVRFFAPLIMAGEGLSAFLCSLLLWRVIDACTGDGTARNDPETEDEEDDDGEDAP